MDFTCEFHNDFENLPLKNGTFMCDFESIKSKCENDKQIETSKVMVERKVLISLASIILTTSLTIMLLIFKVIFLIKKINSVSKAIRRATNTNGIKERLKSENRKITQ